MLSPTLPPHLLDQLADLLKAARTAGADSADGVVVESRSVTANVRQGALTGLERSESLDIGLRVLVGKQAASLSTHDANPARFAALAQQAVAMARLAPADPYAGLAEPEQFATFFPTLDLFDITEPSETGLIDSAKRMETALRTDPKITNVEDCAAAWGLSGFAFMTSNGFTGTARSTGHSLSIEAVAGTGTNMVRDSDYSYTRHAEDLKAPEEVARTAAQRTTSRLNGRKMPTAKVPVVFAPRVAANLVRALVGAVNGASVARKSTFLANALGEQLFAPTIQIIDDPLRPRGLRSRAFDGEGLPTQRREIIKDGKLTTYLTHLAAARQLSMPATGNASRGADGVIGISTGNLYLAPGSVTPEALIADIQQGFYVTETMGFGVNTLTGDFSQGAAGFWIENGAIAHPVHEMTIAGSLRDMFKTLTPANDLVFQYGTDSPTVRIEGMTVGGA